MSDYRYETAPLNWVPSAVTAQRQSSLAARSRWLAQDLKQTAVDAYRYQVSAGKLPVDGAVEFLRAVFGTEAEAIMHEIDAGPPMTRIERLAYRKAVRLARRGVRRAG